MTAPVPNHVYKGVCVRVVDGDTYIIDVDLGYTAHVQVRIRLRGIDVYERSTEQGKRAMSYLKALLIPLGPLPPAQLMIQSYKDVRSFERWVADIWLPDGELLSDRLRKTEYEKPIV